MLITPVYQHFTNFIHRNFVGEIDLSTVTSWETDRNFVGQPIIKTIN